MDRGWSGERHPVSFKGEGKIQAEKTAKKEENKIFKKLIYRRLTTKGKS